MRKNLTGSEFTKLNELVEKCAQCALTSSIRDYKTKSTHGVVKDSDHLFSLLWSCYENSHFAKAADIDYGDFVKEQAHYYVQATAGRFFKSEKRLDIFFPILFYSLIVQNESNYATVIRRANKVSKAKETGNPPPTWNNIDPYRKWKHMYRPEKDEEDFCYRLSDLPMRSRESHLKRNSFIDKDVKEIVSKLPELSGYYYQVRFYSEMSRAGIFLHDILHAAKDNRNILDTLLRIYCVIELQDVLQSCRMICDEEPKAFYGSAKQYKNYDSKQIIKDYSLAKLQDPFGRRILSNTEYEFPIYYIGRNDRPDFDSILSQKSSDTDLFEAYYAYLKNNFIFDMPDIIEFYLNREKLLSFVSADTLLIQYARSLQNLMTFLPKLQKVESETKRVLTICTQISDKKQLVLRQDNVSAFPSEAEEFEHIQKLQSSKVDYEKEWINFMDDDNPPVYNSIRLVGSYDIECAADKNGNRSISVTSTLPKSGKVAKDD